MRRTGSSCKRSWASVHEVDGVVTCAQAQGQAWPRRAGVK